MTALYIILGIIAFFVLILSIKIQVDTEYIDEFTAVAKWLFIKIPLYPRPPKKDKPKKDKKEKEKKPKENDEKKTEEKPKKPNPLKTFYENQGYDGVMKLLSDFVSAAEKFGASFKRHFVFQKLYLWVNISRNQDAAATAVEYGRACEKIFPMYGFICSNFPVREYDCQVEPDFLGSIDKAKFAVSFSLRPIFLINAGIAFAVRVLLKVVLKVIKQKPKTIENNTKSEQGGASL